MKPLISLEDYVSSTGVDNAGEGVVEHVADVEQAHLELCEHDRHLQQVASQLLEGCQHYCALREVEAKLQQAETFQEPVALATAIAVESLLASLGRPKTGQYALESLSETIKTIWQKLIEAFKRAWVHFRAWIDQLLDVAKRMDKRARKMLKELDNYHENPQAKPLTNARLTNALCDITGTATMIEATQAFLITGVDVAKTYGVLVRHMGSIQKAIRAMITFYHRNAKADAAATEKAWKDFLQGTLASVYFNPSFYKSIGAKKSDAPGLKIEHTSLFTKPYSVGNAQFFGRMANSTQDLDEHFGQIAHHVGFGIAPMAVKHHPDAVQPLTKEGIKKVLDLVIGQVDELMKVRDEGKKTISEYERLLRDVQQGITIEGVNPTFEAQLVTVLAQSVTGLLNMTISGERSMRMFQIKLLKHEFDYCALSMGQLTKTKLDKASL
jgi:hypothetical protein